MTLHLSGNHRSKILALVTALWSADSLITLGASALPFGCEGEEKNCATAGCIFPPVTLRIPNASAIPTGEPMTITLCRSDKCLSGQFSLDNADASVPGSAHFTLPTNYTGREPDHADISINRSSGIDIQYTSPYLADGDRYTVTIENASGEELLNKETTVTYTNSYPNGPDCAPQCLQADVTM